MVQDLVGRVILITGATDGIGKAAAMNFAKRGATLTIIGRSKERTAQGPGSMSTWSIRCGNPDANPITSGASPTRHVRRARNMVASCASQFRARTRARAPAPSTRRNAAR
jgi:retinol dehydrogenase 12